MNQHNDPMDDTAYQSNGYWARDLQIIDLKAFIKKLRADIPHQNASIIYQADRANIAEARLEALVCEMRAALELTQFGFNLRRCPVCTGWKVGPYGETDNVHTSDCLVAIALEKSKEIGKNK